MKFVWSLVLLAFLSTSCQPIQQLTLTCDQILATSIADMRGEVVELDQILDSLSESYRVDKEQLEVLRLKDNPVWSGGDVWYVKWSKNGINHQISVNESSTVYRLDLVFGLSQVTAQEIIDCLGQAPQYYSAEHRLMSTDYAAPFHSYSLTLLFPSLGVVVGTVNRSEATPVPPELQPTIWVSRLVYIEPGSPHQIYNQAFGFSVDSKITSEPQPWPGSWEQIEFVDITD